MDDLLEKGRTTLDPNQRKSIYADAQRLFDADPPYLFFYVINNYFPAKPTVKGFTPMASGYLLSLIDTSIG
jgi:peptide/nickel transport system substrate-binding protein